MPLAIRHRYIDVPAGKGSNGTPRRLPPDPDNPPTVSFNTKVGDFGVAIRSFNFEWVTADPNTGQDYEPDHHIREIQVRPQISRANDYALKYWVECQYGDRNFDDKYEGVGRTNHRCKSGVGGKPPARLELDALELAHAQDVRVPDTGERGLRDPRARET